MRNPTRNEGEQTRNEGWGANRIGVLGGAVVANDELNQQMSMIAMLECCMTGLGAGMSPRPGPRITPSGAGCHPHPLGCGGAVMSPMEVE